MLFVLGFFLASFWIPNDPFFENFYVNMACVLSLAFLAFQALYILVCAVLVNERLVKNVNIEGGDGGCSCSAAILVIFFVLLFGANIAWLVMMWINFGTLEGCTYNLVVLVITTVAVIVMQLIVCFVQR